MSGVDVVKQSSGVYAVTVVDAMGAVTEHEVTIPDGFLEETGVGGSDPVQAVRESFDFLLAREAPSSIMRTFDLPTITRFFPDYPDDLRRRLA